MEIVKEINEVIEIKVDNQTCNPMIEAIQPFELLFFIHFYNCLVVLLYKSLNVFL